MFTPGHFARHDIAEVHELIRSQALALLVTSMEGRFEATHIPVVLDARRGEHGTLRFHLARANPAAVALESREEVLLVFVGPPSRHACTKCADCHIIARESLRGSVRVRNRCAPSRGCQHCCPNSHFDGTSKEGMHHAIRQEHLLRQSPAA